MKMEQARVIPFSQVAPERDHWFVDVRQNNDNSFEIKWIEADERHKTAPHWLIMIFAADPYKLPGLINQALNLLEYQKVTGHGELTQ